MQNSHTSTARQVLFWGAMFALIAIVGVVLGADIFRRSSGMTLPEPAEVSLATPVPGGHAKEVVQIVGAPTPGRFEAIVLAAATHDAPAGPSQHDQNADYHLTAHHLQFEQTATTSIVMGASSDVKVGAVVQVTGDFDDKLVVGARQIVILTGVVHVTREQR